MKPIVLSMRVTKSYNVDFDQAEFQFITDIKIITFQHKNRELLVKIQMKLTEPLSELRKDMVKFDTLMDEQSTVLHELSLYLEELFRSSVYTARIYSDDGYDDEEHTFIVFQVYYNDDYLKLKKNGVCYSCGFKPSFVVPQASIDLCNACFVDHEIRPNFD